MYDSTDKFKGTIETINIMRTVEIIQSHHRGIAGTGGLLDNSCLAEPCIQELRLHELAIDKFKLCTYFLPKSDSRGLLAY